MGCECAVAVAQEHADGVVVLVGDDDVFLAVAGQVGHLDVVGIAAGGEVVVRLERAVAVAQEHADCAAAVVGRDDVGDAVAGQVGHRHRDRQPGP